MDDPERVDPFKNKEFVTILINQFEKDYPGKISAPEKQLLLEKPELSKTIFSGGLRNVIGFGKATVTQMDNMPPELFQTLAQDSMTRPIIEDVLTVGQLTRLPTVDTRKASELLESIRMHGLAEFEGKKEHPDFTEASQLLKLSEKQSRELLSSVEYHLKNPTPVEVLLVNRYIQATKSSVMGIPH